MLDFCDAPYQFFPAKPKRSVQWLLKKANRRMFLPGPNHRIRQLDISGGENLKELAASGARILMVVNHPSHSDCQVINEVQHQLGVNSCFMAAYDVFLRGRGQAWFMQGNGAFSIDREGSDKQSMKEAIRIQKEGRFALTIFPEGNVYLNNDRVTPFMEGAAYVALRAQKELGSEHPVYAVPISIKMTYLDDVRHKVKKRIGEVAKLSGVKEGDSDDVVNDLRKIGRAVLAEKMMECRHLPDIGELTADNFQQELETCAEKVISRLEDKMDLEGKSSSSLLDRIRRIRAAIHHIRIRDDGENNQEAVKIAHASEWADEAILAFRILTYATPYVALNPTLDRLAETAQKLNEDYTSISAKPLGERNALVQVNQPISLADMLDQHDGKIRAAVTAATSQMELAVQSGVDRLNESNVHHGNELF